jgi:hypothetical protein
MDISRKTRKGLRELGETLPDNSNIELCLVDKAGRRVCHRFSVHKGVVHHHESHSADFVRAGTGPLDKR